MKRRVEVLLIALAAIVSVVGDAQAASWYIDNASASSGNGQSWATAFKKCSNIVWSNVHAGDVIYISGGPSGGTQTYTESWSIVGASGAAGNPITIAVDSANASHNGTVVFDYDAKGDTATADGVFFANNSYITLTGNVDGQNHIVFKNLHNIVNRTVSRCIVGYNNTGIIFDHIDITNCNNGISVSFTGTGNEIRFSNFTQIRGDAALSVGADGTGWDEIKIHDNYIETLVNHTPPPGQSNYGGPDGIQCYGGMSAYKNVFKVSNTSVYTSSQHPDMFQLQGNYLKIYGNEFVNVGDSHIDYDCYNNSTPHDVWIYNNLFRIVHQRIMWQRMQESHWAVISPPIRTVSPAHKVLHGISVRMNKILEPVPKPRPFQRPLQENKGEYQTPTDYHVSLAGGRACSCPGEPASPGEFRTPWCQYGVG